MLHAPSQRAALSFVAVDVATCVLVRCADCVLGCGGCESTGHSSWGTPQPRASSRALPCSACSPQEQVRRCPPPHGVVAANLAPVFAQVEAQAVFPRLWRGVLPEPGRAAGRLRETDALVPRHSQGIAVVCGPSHAGGVCACAWCRWCWCWCRCRWC